MELYRKALYFYQEPVVLLSSEGYVIDASFSFEKLVKCSIELLKNCHIDSLCRNLSSSENQSILNDDWQGAIEWISPDGLVHNLFAKILRLANENNDVGYYLTCSDLNLSNSDFALVQGSDQQQKLESIGLYAGSMAHDLNNILAGILGHISFLRLALPDNQHADSIKAIEEGTKRAASLTNQILDFSKGQASEFIELNLTPIVSTAISIISSSLGEGIKIVYQQENDYLPIFACESQISQIVFNLIVNARDAIENLPGTIEVSVKQVKNGPNNTHLAENPCAVLSVKDSGHGIPKELQSSIFNAFFTTKSTKGTGLGLATVKAIVNEHKAHIEFDSILKQGTEFRVYLPLQSTAENFANDQRLESKIEESIRHEKILVVDDEDSVRLILEKSLEHLGYQVLAVENGIRAIEEYSKSPKSFDLVMLDMIMPHMPGEEVFFALKEINPGVKVLISSGYANDKRVQEILSGGGLGILKKPFTIEQLAKKVKECLVKN